MPDLPAPTVPSNAPDHDGTPTTDGYGEPVTGVPVVDVPPVPAPVPDTLAPGVYTNGVLTANVVDGAIVAIPKATP